MSQQPNEHMNLMQSDTLGQVEILLHQNRKARIKDLDKGGKNRNWNVCVKIENV